MRDPLAFVSFDNHACAIITLGRQGREAHVALSHFQVGFGISEAERMRVVIENLSPDCPVNCGANNGLTEVDVVRFPNQLCTDRGRAINQREPGWQKTLTGYPKELYDFWEKNLKDRGYKVGFQMVDCPGGRPGDIGITLRWK